MSKKHSKSHPKGAGLKLVGSPKDLINLLIVNTVDRKQATETILNSGPKHKQVLSALLLKRVYKLVQTIEKTYDTTFAVQNGEELVVEKHDEKTVLPVSIPINIDPKKDKNKVVKAISQAPEHEALTFTICLQAIEWAIKTTVKK